MRLCECCGYERYLKFGQVTVEGEIYSFPCHYYVVAVLLCTARCLASERPYASDSDAIVLIPKVEQKVGSLIPLPLAGVQASRNAADVLDKTV